ncbi:hypothetical protein A4X13_0g7870 [Tilletia indica]|uniref:Protein kinase domain-containing protein n=1 Tax=Tilletia indica TaxID=43049 RepID=A0A8T8SHV8_9BASI|nr:hypothetical protein A4X13_0g7870 [Tilletia indica]
MAPSPGPGSRPNHSHVHSHGHSHAGQGISHAMGMPPLQSMPSNGMLTASRPPPAVPVASSEMSIRNGSYQGLLPPMTGHHGGLYQQGNSGSQPLIFPPPMAAAAAPPPPAAHIQSFRARDAHGAPVALKIVNLDTPEDQDVADIQREVVLLSQLRDADRYNAVRYWGCWTEGPEIWLVMDLAEGGSVRTLMKAGPIAERYASIIVHETLMALAFLHRSGILHRDVKADNILLTNAGHILLCDFGVAASLASATTISNKRSTFLGTPCWTALEVVAVGDGKLYGFHQQRQVHSYQLFRSDVGLVAPSYGGGGIVIDASRSSGLELVREFEGGSTSADTFEFGGPGRGKVQDRERMPVLRKIPSTQF